VKLEFISAAGNLIKIREIWESLEESANIEDQKIRHQVFMRLPASQYAKNRLKLSNFSQISVIGKVLVTN